MKFTDVFSPKRFWYLLSRDFLAVYRPLLVTLGASGVVVLFFSFISSALQGTGRIHYFFFFVILYTVGCILASLVFNPMHKKEKNMEFLMMPASILEKFLVKWLLVTVGFPLAMILMSSGVSLISEGINKLLFDRVHVFFNPVDPAIWKGLLFFMIFQSLFFLGGAYFRKVQFIWSLLLIGTFAFVALILSIVFIGMVMWTSFLESAVTMTTMNQIGGAGNTMDLAVFLQNALGSKYNIISWTIRISFFGLLAPLSYVIAYFRLKESQVSYGV
jgi:hypothetical protein